MRTVQLKIGLNPYLYIPEEEVVIFSCCCRIGFVTQDDVLFPQLTVEETLVFAAFLRLPSRMSRHQKYERVELIVKELGLERLVRVSEWLWVGLHRVLC